MLWILLGLIISYLVGSIPTAYIFGRIIKKTDIRKFGSGNVGATNALRLLGRGWGATVLVLDILKGFLPVVILPSVIGAGANIPLESFCIILGLSCICGHNWTIFLNFKGGKGVATTLGVLLGLSIKIAGLKIILGITILIWLVVFVISRTISLASVLAALSFPLLTVLFRQSIGLILIVTLLAAFIIFRHRSNIKRILKGQEPKLNFKK
ncbi:MAG: glycerol-3-phosphate 1-O-acyltransferase PlsY [Candidatus Omnitrophota bacterium]|jgi:glycerol-3-phosphate acyltransferase PlsY|nr:glycerol-3-phosphate 1-O-acyltransferase PlsY [Candidatus Omnitrophota bacterium]